MNPSVYAGSQGVRLFCLTCNSWMLNKGSYQNDIKMILIWGECERQLHYFPLPFIIPLFPTLFVVLVCVSQAITDALLYVLYVCGVDLLPMVVQRLIASHSIP